MGLVLAKHFDRNVSIRAIGRFQSGDLATDGRKAGNNLQLLAILQQACARLGGCSVTDDLAHRFLGLRAHNGHRAGLDDAGLFGGDFLDGVTQPLHVVHADRADDAGCSIHHVGGIPQATHTHFDDGDVDRSVGEGPDRHDGQHFEEAHASAKFLLFRPFVGHVDEVAHLQPQVDEALVRDWLAVDADAFCHLFQVWGGVQASAHAIGAKQCFGQR